MILCWQMARVIKAIESAQLPARMHPNPQHATVSYTEGLLNQLRYSTKHLKDESTPEPIKKRLLK